jgi:hypothetical protein
MDQTIDDKARTEFIRLIKIHIGEYDKYTFRPIKIDGIDCYVVIYDNPKIVNFEAIHVYCKFERNGQKYDQAYSVYHFNYKTIEGALTKIEKVANSFKIFDGDLVAADQYKMLQLEKMVIPYREEQTCCVCFGNTYDTTHDCNHYICLQCRSLCILNKKPDCPVCRKDNALKFYSNDMKLVNNCEYDDIYMSIEGMNNVSHDDDSNHSSDSSSSSSESSIRSDSPPPLIHAEELDNRTPSPDTENPLNYHTPIAFMYWRRLLERSDE